MRENRSYGSEGGAIQTNGSSLPLSFAEQKSVAALPVGPPEDFWALRGIVWVNSRVLGACK